MPPEPHLSRRHFLGAAGTALVLGQARTSGADGDFPGMIVREREPQNLEFPFGSLDGFRVPAEHFYVRNHFAVPKIDPTTWRLKVEGAVEKPLELTLDALKKLGEKTFACTLECAGNGRVFLVPKVRGVAWGLGAVGNAEWTGVPLAAVLDRAGVKKSAVDVVLEGADTGTINDDPKSPGPIAFARSLPLEKARKPEVLLAYGMNGADLPPAHGAPLRAVVGGWYGMASVKWLGRIVVTDKPFQGFFQSLDYTYFKRQSGIPSVVPITGMQVKASVARPITGATVRRGQPFKVAGAAWAGEADVAKVDVSDDGGKTWRAAKLLGEPVPFAWRLWEFDWLVPDRVGRAALVARATDSQGRTQPEKRDPDRRTYMINHLVPTEVEIR